MFEQEKPTVFANPNFWVRPGYSVIGTCSFCGGAVTVPTVWAGVIPPTPTCASCGAIKKQSYGPVIEIVTVTRSTPSPRASYTLGYNSIFPSDSK